MSHHTKNILTNKMKSEKPMSHFMAFSQEVPNPVMPDVFHQKGYNWVNFGKDNLYPNNIITPIYNSSAMARTCVNSKLVYTVGEGLHTKDPDLEYILKRANPMDSWNDIFKRAALDQLIYGGFYLQIIWDELGENIAEIYNMDFNDIRSGLIDKDTDKVEFYWYSPNWADYKKNHNRPTQVKSFDPSQAHLYPRQILFYRNYNPAEKYYCLPDWSGSITAANVDIMIDSFHWYNLQQGLAPSLFINMCNGIPDASTQQEIYQTLASTYSGVDGAGKFFLSFSDSKEHGTEVTTLDAANSDYYIQLSQRISQSLITGFRITSPLLLGIKDLGGAGLGNNKEEILAASSLFTNTVIIPIQKNLLKIFDRLIGYYGYDTELYIEQLKLFNEDNEQIGEKTVDAIQ